MSQFNHPSLRPLWVRVLVVAVCLIWALVELATGDIFWAILFGSGGLFLIWRLLLKFEISEGED